MRCLSCYSLRLKEMEVALRNSWDYNTQSTSVMTESAENNFSQLTGLHHDKILLPLNVCRFGTGLPMTRKQLHTEFKSTAKSTPPGWRTFCPTPSTSWKSEPATVQGVDLPARWLRPSPGKHVSLSIYILDLSQTNTWFSHGVGAFERNVLPSNLSTFGF